MGWGNKNMLLFLRTGFINNFLKQRGGSSVTSLSGRSYHRPLSCQFHRVEQQQQSFTDGGEISTSVKSKCQASRRKMTPPNLCSGGLRCFSLMSYRFWVKPQCSQWTLCFHPVMWLTKCQLLCVCIYVYTYIHIPFFPTHTKPVERVRSSDQACILHAP